MQQSLILDVLFHALAVALSPEAIFTAVLILLTPRARSNGLAYLGGWMVGLAVVSAIVLITDGLVSGSPGLPGKSTFAGSVRLTLGLVLFALAVRRWQRRTRRGEVPPEPRWMAALDRFGFFRSFAVGFLLSGINPKNVALTVTAATHFSLFDRTALIEALTMAIFVLLASTTIAAPVIWYHATGIRSHVRLRRLKDWLISHNDAVIIVLLVVFGAKLCGDGLNILTG